VKKVVFGNRELTNKQWIRKTVAHSETGCVPYNFMFTPPALRVLEKYYQTQDLERMLGFPIRMIAPVSIKPLYADPAIYGKTIKDEFGVVWSTSEVDRGSPIGPCLLNPELSKYKFPEVGEKSRFEGLEGWCGSNRKNYTIIWIGDLWERATFMRGMENLLMDVALNPSFVSILLRGITEYILETMNILFDICEFDGIALSDDYGSQDRLTICPEDWREMVKPCLIEIYTLAKNNGRTVFHHSCGHITPIIPDLIEIGLDILHPIQPETMDIFELKREYGNDLTFCGGLGTQWLLPYGSPVEICDEINRLHEEMGRGGGYILEPGISLQADIPLENMVAMIEASIPKRRR
jgi:uroporphyrinogen decarboxylase